jgi:hypothetical protein
MASLTTQLHPVTLPQVPVILILVMLCPLLFGAAENTGEGEEFDAPPPVFGLAWLDQTQSFASNSANSLANQLDRFFGVQRSDMEAAYSSLRLTTIQSWNDIDNFETGIRLRGKVHLPRINERVSLIFSEEDGDGTTYYTQNAASISQQETTRVNLEVDLTEDSAHHLFFRVGVRSGLKGRVSMRYRYEPDTDGSTENRFTQSLYFKDGKGFGSFSRYQVDHIISDDALLRWTNDLRFEETYSGSEYTTSLEYLTSRSNRTAISWYGRINGETRPDFVASYDLGFRLRKNIYREWLFVELEPGYTWRKEAINLDRKGTPYVFLRLEMAIGSFN